VAYQEIICNQHLECGVRAALDFPGPVLVRVLTDYRDRPIRWIDAARQRFTQELSPAQKVRFLARIGSRALDVRPQND
jgi:acetolactate synthase-1/2/3 large subunit